MGGIPSLKFKINGFLKYCLLDTGARINVIDEDVIKDWKNVKRRLSEENVSCANGSPLTTRGKVILEVEIDKNVENVEFVVAVDLSPKIIAGIEMLTKFGIKLSKKMKNRFMSRIN